jgi:hypothetical protein
MTSFRAGPHLCGCLLALIGCWLLLASCAAPAPVALEDQGRKLADNQVVLPMIAAPAEGRRCDGESGNTHIVAPNYNPHINKQQPQTYYHATEDAIQSSIAVATDFLLAGKFDRARSVERQYFEASARHDLCYQHGSSTYGRDRSACDDRIFSDMYRLCGLANNKTHWGRASCDYRPQFVWAGVSTFGGVFSSLTGSAASNNICEYEAGGFQPARDHLVIGHFDEAKSDAEQILELVAAPSEARDACSQPTVLQGRLVNESAAPQEIFRLCLDRISLGHSAPDQSLSGLGFMVPDLLSHAPVRARLENPNQAADDIVLIGFHEAGMHGSGVGASYGTVMIPLRIEKIPPRAESQKNIRAFQIQHGQADHRLASVRCAQSSSGDCWRPQDGGWLKREREMLLAPLYHVRVLPRCGAGVTGACADGEQLLSLHTFRGKKDGGGVIAIATVAFRYQAQTGFDLVGINSNIITSEFEAYKRFQHPPVIFDDNNDGLDDVHFLFRDPHEDALTTLMVESYHPARIVGSKLDLDLAWSTEDNTEPVNAAYGGVMGWSRESYVWMTLGVTASSLGGGSYGPHGVTASSNNAVPQGGTLISEFLSNCWDDAGKNCSGPETIRIRTLAKRAMMEKPAPWKLSGRENGGEKNCDEACEDISCVDHYRDAKQDCARGEEYWLAPQLPNSPTQQKSAPLSPSELRPALAYMKLPVLTGRFGNGADNGPGVAFFRAWADKLAVLRVWRPEGEAWRAKVAKCTLPKGLLPYGNDGADKNYAFNVTRQFPMELVGGGAGKPSVLMLSYRDPAGANSLGAIRYARFHFAKGDTGNSGSIFCEKDKDWEIARFPARP